MIRLQELELVFGQTDTGQRTHGWTDRHDVGNSILDAALDAGRLKLISITLISLLSTVFVSTDKPNIITCSTGNSIFQKAPFMEG